MEHTVIFFLIVFVFFSLAGVVGISITLAGKGDLVTDFGFSLARIALTVTSFCSVLFIIYIIMYFLQ